MKFEWDTRKAEINFKKHKVAFTEAATVFADTLGITIYDPDHSKDEERYITIGHSHQESFGVKPSLFNYGYGKA